MHDLNDHPKAKGERSEAVILAEFVKRGITVMTPFGDNARYDLIIDAGGLHRVQVKTGRFKEGCVRFDTRSNGDTKREVRKPYHGEADLFAVYCPSLEESYIIPVEETGTSEMWLRVNQPERERENMNFADEYTIEDWL